ncbi:MAG: long-chain acyl-CoA synthetase, partial [Cocleimonas sp.]
MEKVWLKSYPEGVPEFIDTSEYKSLADLFEKSIAEFKDRPAYTNLGRSISFSELDELSRDFAAYLTNQGGLKKGDRIAIMMPNLIQYPIVLFAALRAGLIVVNTNPLYTDRELEHQLKDSDAQAIVILENFAHTLADVIEHTNVKTVITTRVGDMAKFPKSLLVNFVVQHVKKMVPAFTLSNAISFGDVLSQGKDQAFANADLKHDDVAFLQYTGGTTGVAKGAALTHENMIANLLQAYTWASKDLDDGQETFITALPL